MTKEEQKQIADFVRSWIHEIITESGTDKNAHTNEVLRKVADEIEKKDIEPCEDAISFPNGTLKKRGKGYVVYNPEWLKENWRTELKVMGIECEDAISRADTIEWLKRVTVTDGITFETGFKQILTDIQNMPSVTPKQKMGRWLHPYRSDVACECSFCHIQMPITNDFHYCPECGAKMSENPTGSNCTACILDGTDACTRGAGRAVDGGACEDFVGESED